VLFLFAACERHPLIDESSPDPTSPIPTEMSPRGPQAGPLSTVVPQLVPFSGAAPAFQVRRGLSLADIPSGLLPAGAGLVAPSRLNPITPLQVDAPRSTGILWENRNSGERVIWHMIGPIFGGQATVLPQVDPSWHMVAGTADFNRDGHADILWQHIPSGTVVVWYMNGFDFTGAASTIGQTGTSEWRIAGVGDFNGNGHSDILWQHLPSGTRAVWFMNGASFTGQTEVIGPVDPSWDIAGVGDFNEDGKPDLLWQHSSGARVIWFLNGTAYEGQHAFLPQVEPEWDIAGVANLYGTGMTDILWQHRGSGWRAIWMMNGATWTGTGTTLPLVPAEWNMAGAFGAFIPPEPPPPGPLDGAWSYNATLTAQGGGPQVSCSLQNMTLLIGHDEDDVSVIGGIGAGGTWGCGAPGQPIEGFLPVSGTFTAPNTVNFAIGTAPLWLVANNGTLAGDGNTITGTAQLTVQAGARTLTLVGPFTATRVVSSNAGRDVAARNKAPGALSTRRIFGIPTAPTGADLEASTRAAQDVLTAEIQEAIARARAESGLR
jgi:hypothetical protein